MPNDPQVRRQVANSQPRDENGHFVKKPKPALSAPESALGSSESLTKAAQPNPLVSFVKDSTHYSKSQEDLLDIHIGNPLGKIQKLLEDIKKQKAFSFDIKGSLGLAGIALTLGVFGIFGGTKALCSKGVQTKIGILRVLPIKEIAEPTFLERIPLLNWYLPKRETDRVVLIDSQKNTIRLVSNMSVSVLNYNNLEVSATGDYDSCALALRLEKPQNLLPY